MGLCPIHFSWRKEFLSFSFLYLALFSKTWSARSIRCLWRGTVTASVVGEGREQVLMVHLLRSRRAHSLVCFFVFFPNLKKIQTTWLLGPWCLFSQTIEVPNNGANNSTNKWLLSLCTLPSAPTLCSRESGMKASGVFVLSANPIWRLRKLGSTGSTGCQVLPSLAGCISLSGDGSSCQVLTALTYAHNFLLFCHERDPCPVLLLGADPCCGGKGQQELDLHLQMCLVFTPWVLCHAW